MPGVLVLQPDGTMASLKPAPFAEEARFQELLAQYHDLLAGDQIDPDAPRRWLFVDREVGVPDAADSADRWSLDHLFIDQDAIPTFVEVKRASDTRNRREVVAQMLDYAANGSTYWPVETIRELFEQRCVAERKEPEQELRALMGEGADAEIFWRAVKTNLQAGRIRLMFVADDVPASLRRIVEFLNEQMDPAEVLAVEVRQYEGQGIRTRVPRSIWEMVQARDKKATQSDRRASPWDEESFFSKLVERGDQAEQAVCRQIFDWCSVHVTSMDYGRGTQQIGLLHPVPESRGGVVLAPEGVHRLRVGLRRDSSRPDEDAALRRSREECICSQVERRPGCIRRGRPDTVSQLPGEHPSRSGCVGALRP